MTGNSAMIREDILTALSTRLTVYFPPDVVDRTLSIIAGTLAYIGIGKLDEDCIQRAIRERDRLLLGPTAPPEGLELNEVYYSPAWGIADITKRS